ncbi:hypothetical protein CASFOL_008186 [Castilleja foliolosa]|uniref:DUF4378 domain-containing protein n=1 Tax=Castilleja foliolosa TaxID=1961234 RepID=A0ABD3DY88_9LAMI
MDSSLIRVRPKKALLLKDHLLDEMSSCSSNGFKSFPRKSPCCATVRFLHGVDRKHKQQQKKVLTFDKTPSKSALSAFRSVLAAVKSLPFGKPPEKIKPSCSSLGRRFSRKILEKSGFLKKKKPEQKVIGNWKSFDQLMKEESELEPSARSDSSRDFESNSWSGSDFTVSEDCYSGKYCSSEVKLNSDDVVKDGVGENDAVSMDLTTSSADGSVANTNPTKQCQSDEEKEQFSPVSVLDCPFDDEDEVSSSLQHRIDRMEGTKTKLMKKIERFECLAELEPVNLATQFALQSDNSDNESTGSHYSYDQSISNIEENEDNENEAEQKAFELLNQLKVNYLQSYPDLKLNEDTLLQDFFNEKIVDKCENREKQRGHVSYEGLLEEAENWINMKRTREHHVVEAYIEDMEKRGEWRILDQERKEVALELEDEVFDELMNEVLLMLDISL